MAEEKIGVEICCGTACYMLGGGELLELASQMPEAWLEYLDVRAIPCLDLCTREDLSGAPYVRIGGEVFGSMTKDKMLAKLAALIAAKGGANE